QRGAAPRSRYGWMTTCAAPDRQKQKRVVSRQAFCRQSEAPTSHGLLGIGKWMVRGGQLHWSMKSIGNTFSSHPPHSVQASGGWNGRPGTEHMPSTVRIGAGVTALPPHTVALCSPIDQFIPILGAPQARFMPLVEQPGPIGVHCASARAEKKNRTSDSARVESFMRTVSIREEERRRRAGSATSRAGAGGPARGRRAAL